MSYRTVALLCVSAVAVVSFAQTHFEVASIRPTDPAFTLKSMRIPLDDGMVSIRGLSLKELIQFAWGNAEIGNGLHPALVSGGPSWVAHDRYDVTAKSPGNRIPSRADRKQMLQALLIERFQLTFHRETKPAAVYVLAIGKNGPKMRPRQPDDGGAPFSLPLRGLRLPGRNVSMIQLADLLQVIIPLTDPDREDLPVLDRTGLAGRFDFDLTWSGDPSLNGGRGGGAALDTSNAPDILTAIQEQLGLRLEAVKAPVAIFVIDRAVKPSEN